MMLIGCRTNWSCSGIMQMSCMVSQSYGAPNETATKEVDLTKHGEIGRASCRERV